MRLWHYKLIPFLPDKQLRGQWSELNLIYKTQKKHRLINFMYDYPKHDLLAYSILIINELVKRDIKIKNMEKFERYFDGVCVKDIPNYQDFVPFKNKFNKRYMAQCFYNLQEKYDCSQPDFTKELYDKL